MLKSLLVTEKMRIYVQRGIEKCSYMSLDFHHYEMVNYIHNLAYGQHYQIAPKVWSTTKLDL